MGKIGNEINVNINHLDQKQLATRWNISESTLVRWRIAGIGPVFLKLGNRIRYRLEDVERYEKHILRKSTSERALGGDSWT